MRRFVGVMVVIRRFASSLCPSIGGLHNLAEMGARQSFQRRPCADAPNEKAEFHPLARNDLHWPDDQQLSFSSLEVRATCSVNTFDQVFPIGCRGFFSWYGCLAVACTETKSAMSSTVRANDVRACRL